jgi:hypothetical protein
LLVLLLCSHGEFDPDRVHAGQGRFEADAAVADGCAAAQLQWVSDVMDEMTMQLLLVPFEMKRDMPWHGKRYWDNGIGLFFEVWKDNG